MILPTLSDVPVHHPDCCLSISDNLFSVLEHATSAIPGSVLSIGAGTGLFEAILASRDRTRVVEGVEVSSSVNKYLPEESAYVVSGTWDLCSRARDAAIWIFVYPRVPELVKRYFNTFGNSNVRLAIFLGPRADWADFQDSFQAPEFTSPDVIEECGLVPYEMMAIVNRPQRSAPSTPQRLKSARNIHASLSATPTTNHAALSKREAKDLWEHTALLFRNYDWSEAVVCTQRLLRRSQHTVGLDSAAVWANLGILRMHLGEYYLAFEAFEKAMKVVGVSVAGESDPDDECTSCASAASSPSTSVPLFLPSPSLRPQPWPRARKQSSHAETSNPAVLTPGSLRTDTALIKRVTSALAQHFATPADGSGSGSVPTHRHPHLALQRHPHLTRYQHFPHHKYHQHLPTTAIFPFLAALAAYHLPRDDPDSPGSTADTASLRLAQRLFRTCLLLLPEGVEKVDMASRGLAWTLERTRVVWNERICGVEAGLEEGMGELVAGERWGVNGLPGRLCFEFVERK